MHTWNHKNWANIIWVMKILPRAPKGVLWSGNRLIVFDLAISRDYYYTDGWASYLKSVWMLKVISREFRHSNNMIIFHLRLIWRFHVITDWQTVQRPATRVDQNYFQVPDFQVINYLKAILCFKQCFQSGNDKQQHNMINWEHSTSFKVYSCN
jgi:hypothetical protein